MSSRASSNPPSERAPNQARTDPPRRALVNCVVEQTLGLLGDKSAALLRGVKAGKSGRLSEDNTRFHAKPLRYDPIRPPLISLRSVARPSANTRRILPLRNLGKRRLHPENKLTSHGGKYVCMVITYSRVWIDRVRLQILLVVS